MAFTADKVRQGVQKDTGYSIDNSLRFNDDDSAYLSRTPSSAGNRKTWTWSGWVKNGNISIHRCFFSALTSTNEADIIQFRTNDIFEAYWNGSNSGILNSSAKYRDPSAWYHIVVAVDTTQGTAANRVKYYINGTQITDHSTVVYPSQDYETSVNNNVLHHLGTRVLSSSSRQNYFDGYLAEVHFIDGQALDPTSFGETGTYGEWKPIEVTGMTYGTNGFYLPFSNTGTKHTITANGDAQHSTAQSKIGGSSMYFDGSGDYLTIPSTSDFDFGTGDYTLEFWIRNGTANPIMHIDAYDGSGLLISYEGSGYVFRPGNGGGWGLTLTHTVSLDSSNWHHISVVCSSGTTTMYYDGVGVANSTTVVDVDWAGAVSGIGGRYGGSPIYAPYIGYLDEIRISNSARYTSNFTPSTTAFTEDANTLLLIHSDTTNGSTTFTDDSGVVGGLGTDASSNTNNWTVNNLAATDQMLDTPTNNFPVFSPIYKPTGNTDMTVSDGGLKITSASGADSSIGQSWSFGDVGQPKKWYFETYIGSGGQNIGFYIQIDGKTMWDMYGYYLHSSTIVCPSGESCSNTARTSGAFASGDLMQIAIDMENGKMWLGKNGTWDGSGDPVAGTNWQTTITGNNLRMFLNHGASAAYTQVWNFGQDSSFAGNKTAQGNADGNGYGDFYYTPPTDFLALCTSNLPDPAVIPSEHFNTVLWTGTGSSNARTDVGFQPDFTWIKGRSHISNHRLMNSIAGATKYLLSNAPQAEGTDSQVMSSFDSNGFTVGTEDDTNGSSKTFVAWNWKAGGTGVSNTNGSITSTVSANADAGFSIVSYTGTGSNATIGHGLSKAPEMVIVKGRNQISHWMFGSDGLTSWVYSLKMDNTSAESSDATKWNSTAPTSSVFNVGTEVFTGGSGKTFIAYCFHSVDGYSKMGSYTGNGITDGTFVYTGFRPAYVMIKRASGGVEMWNVFDDARSPYNLVNDYIKANDAGAENVNHTTLNLDFTSNGFKVRGTNTGINTSWATYIFLAFAEQPFKHSNAR